MTDTRIPDTLAASGVLSSVVTALADVKLVLQVVVLVLTIGSLIWSITANMAKKRHYDRERQ